jgi:hypothetical protein
MYEIEIIILTAVVSFLAAIAIEKIKSKFRDKEIKDKYDRQQKLPQKSPRKSKSSSVKIDRKSKKSKSTLATLEVWPVRGIS